VGEEVDRAIRMLPRSEKSGPRSYVTYMPPSSGVDSSVTGLPSDGGASYAAAMAEGRPADTDPDLGDVVSGSGSVVPSVGAIAAGVAVPGSAAWMFSWYAGERVEGMVGTPQGRMIRADSAEARYLYAPGEGDLMDRVREAGRLSFHDNNTTGSGVAGAAGAAPAAGAAGATAAGAAGLARGAASGVRWSNAQQMGMRPTRIPLSGQPQQGTGTGTRGTGVRGGQAQQTGARGTSARGGQAQGGRGTGVRGGQAQQAGARGTGGARGMGRGTGTGGVRGGQAQGARGTGVRGGQAQQSGVRGAGMRGAGRGRKKRDERERKWSPEVWCAVRGREVPDPQEEERRKEEALKRLDAVWLSRHGAESVRERQRREAEEATRREMFSRPLLYWREPRENGQQQ